MIDSNKEIFIMKIEEVINDHYAIHEEILADVMDALMHNNYDTDELEDLFNMYINSWK